MANGSFGLSGFPTAPTTTSGSSGGANNPAASVTATVQSTDGFLVGDLIYQRSNSFGTVPGNAVSTSTFPVTGLVPSMSASTGSQNNSSLVTNLGQEYGGSQNTNMAAKLTNGNVVYVFKAGSTSAALGVTSTAAYFKIVDQNGTTVVNTTAVDGTNAVTNPTIGVIALTGGGFVVFYNFSTNPRYAVFSNTGSVVTAAQTDTGITLTAATGSNIFSMRAAARPDGSWVLCVKPSGANTLSHRIYGATGTALYAWTSNSNTQDNSYAYDLVCRADNSTVIVTPASVLANGLSYTVISSTNAVTVAQTNFLIDGGSNPPAYWGNVALLSDGNVVIGYYVSTRIFYRTLTSANVLGGEVTVSNGVAQDIQSLNVGASSTGGFLMAAMGRFSTPYAGVLYCALNASYTGIFGTGTLKFLPAIPYATTAHFSIIDTGSYIGLFFSMYNSGLVNTNSYTRFDKTTFFPVGFNSISTTTGSTPALSVSGYARGNSSPTGASFLASASSVQYGNTTAVTSSSQSSFTTVSIRSGLTIVELDSTTFTDGSIAFIYRATSGLVEAKIFSTANVVLATITVDAAASTSSTAIGYSRIVQLENGKIAVSYLNSAGSITVKVYSSAYALLNTTTNTSTRVTAGFQVSLAPIRGSRIVFGYTNASNAPCFVVYSETLTVLTSEVSAIGSVTFQASVAAMPFGFVLSFVVTSSNYRYYVYQETTTNVWSLVNNVSTGSFGYPYNHKVSSHPAGWFTDVYATTTTGDGIGLVAYTGGNLTSLTANTIVNSSATVQQNSTRVAGCATANGMQVSFTANGSGVVSLVVQSPYIIGNSTAVTLTFASALTNMCATPIVGNRVALAYVQSSVASYAVFDVYQTDGAVAITAGVTPSNASLALSQPTGYTLLGVSTTEAAAGGTGTVQINGPATLNSQYSTSLNQAFDFQNPVTYGVKGVVNGLNVNLQGNV